MSQFALFYATNNQSKLHNMRYRLRKHPIHVFSPDDFSIHLNVDENGKTATENALIKAQAYYSIVKMPTIAGDSSMYIDGIPDQYQPGLYVRRVNGNVLSDEEMIEYYANLAAAQPHDCYIHYFTGIAMITNRGTFTTTLTEVPLKLSSIPNPNRRHRGNPLDVITMLPDGKYFNDLSDTERVSLDKVGEQRFIDFILNHLL